MILNVHACPNCGETSFAVEVKTWVNIDAAEDNSPEYPHFDSATARFDDEDAQYAEPIEGAEIICRTCNTTFNNVAGAIPTDVK